MFLLRLLAWLASSRQASSATPQPMAHTAMRAWSIGSMIARYTRYHDQR